METLARDIATSLDPSCDLTVLSLGSSNHHLVWWLPLAVARSLWWAALRRRFDSVLLGDAVVNTALGPWLRLARVPYAVMVMGLDVTWRAPGYRALVRGPLRLAPRVIAISRASAEAAIACGAGRDRTSVLRLAITPPRTTLDRSEARRRLTDRTGVPSDAFVVTTLGRLVPRKGMLWFAREVLPGTPEDVHYVVAGRGPDLAALQALATSEDRLHVMGPVDDDGREVLLRGSDLFVQANVPVPGDMEGFGLVTLEAAIRDLPVAASGLEGITDVVVDGVNGWVLPPGDAEAWRDRIRTAAAAPAETARAGREFGRAARECFSLERMGAELLSLLPGAAADGRHGLADRPADQQPVRR
jgi:glycosyltransferase involved in cell wall biosynthesis